MTNCIRYTDSARGESWRLERLADPRNHVRLVYVTDADAAKSSAPGHGVTVSITWFLALGYDKHWWFARLLSAADRLCPEKNVPILSEAFCDFLRAGIRDVIECSGTIMDERCNWDLAQAGDEYGKTAADCEARFSRETSFGVDPGLFARVVSGKPTSFRVMHTGAPALHFHFNRDDNGQRVKFGSAFYVDQPIYGGPDGKTFVGTVRDIVNDDELTLELSQSSGAIKYASDALVAVIEKNLTSRISEGSLTNGPKTYPAFDRELRDLKNSLVWGVKLERKDGERPQVVLYVDSYGSVAKHTCAILPRPDWCDRLLAGAKTLWRYVLPEMATDIIDYAALKLPGANDNMVEWNDRMMGAAPAAATHTPCDECGDTGFYQGFQVKEPCSQGCKP